MVEMTALTSAERRLHHAVSASPLHGFVTLSVPIHNFIVVRVPERHSLVRGKHPPEGVPHAVDPEVEAERVFPKQVATRKVRVARPHDVSHHLQGGAYSTNV